MAFRFRKIEAVSDGVRRVVCERIDNAAEQLQATGDEREEGIHQARKRFKEIRAVLRLVRYELGDRYTVENRWYRDSARSLAQARDAQAVIETWDKLHDCFPDEFERKQMAAVRKRLEKRLRRVSASEGVDASDAVLDALTSARDRVQRWPLADEGFAALRPGARRSYAQGQRNYDRALARETDEAFHEWRKRVKDLWYHTTLLRRIWDDVMSVRKRQLKTLSDTLGDDHDLVVLRELMRREPELFGAERQQSRLAGLIDTRQQTLRASARDLGALIYAEEPDAYIRRIEAYWHVWRAEKPA